jgi:hypothetical protein
MLHDISSQRLLEDAVHAITDSFNCSGSYSLFEIELTIFCISEPNSYYLLLRSVLPQFDQYLVIYTFQFLCFLKQSTIYSDEMIRDNQHWYWHIPPATCQVFCLQTLLRIITVINYVYLCWTKYHREREHTPMDRMGFEPIIKVFEWPRSTS